MPIAMPLGACKFEICLKGAELYVWKAPSHKVEVPEFAFQINVTQVHQHERGTANGHNFIPSCMFYKRRILESEDSSIGHSLS